MFFFLFEVRSSHISYYNVSLNRIKCIGSFTSAGKLSCSYPILIF